ncbi:aldo/keto reductase [bacterium]|nr:aldo/keto reductase [bacterium]
MKVNRRQFIKTSVAGTTALLFKPAMADVNPFQRVALGRTGLSVSRIAMGTGVKASHRQSNLTRMGMEAAKSLVRHAYDQGVRFFDCADTYGTHPHVAAALKGLPRDSYVLSTKLWLRPGGIPEPERPDADIVIDRFRKELNTDYIDLIQLHCMFEPNWPQLFRRQMDILESLKDQGVIRTHGVSVHSLYALQACVYEPWVDTVHVRINPFGDKMDAREPEPVIALIEQLHKAGKGIIAMKLIGEGLYRNAPEKIDATLKLVLGINKVDVLLVGFDRPEQIEDLSERVAAILRG